MAEDILLKRLKENIKLWHENDQFSRIIDAIEYTDRSKWDYDIILALGRAYNNLAMLGDEQCRRDIEDWDNPENQSLIKKAIEILLTIENKGKDDPLWCSRMAFAYYSLADEEDKAMEYAKRWFELAPNDPDAKQLIDDIKTYLFGLENVEE